MAEALARRVLQPLQLTEAGRPLLHDGEVECQLLDGVDLEVSVATTSLAESGEALKSGLVTLTTFRVLWINEQASHGFALPLASVCRVFPPKKSIKNMFASPRLRLQVWSNYDGGVTIHGVSGADSSIMVTLVLRGHISYDPFLFSLGELMKTKPWEGFIPAAMPSAVPVSAPSLGEGGSIIVAQASKLNPSMAGVSGILRKEQQQWEKADKDLQEAFQDLSALMSKAKEMVSLAEKMHTRLLAHPSQLGSGENEDSGSKQEMQDMLLSIGIASPVTKETAGALYHQQLSRQLADFVKGPLQKAGGMLAMVDVYCLFNRARGTELISPEDMLQACAIWEKIDVPMRMRQFDSGVLVIQIKSRSDDEVFSKLLQLVERVEALRTGISATDASRALGVAPALAKEHLIAAENRGLLCRDDGVDGLRFFANFFNQIDQSLL